MTLITRHSSVFWKKRLKFGRCGFAPFASCPIYWHLVLWPESERDLPAFMQRLTNTPVQRSQQNKRLVGTGHVYQGRYKSFPVETDEYFYQVLRYVERNALRANIVAHAEDRRWFSLWCWNSGSRKHQALLSVWPLPRPRQWTRLVNEPQNDAELEAFGCGSFVTTLCDQKSEGQDRIHRPVVHLPRSPFQAASLSATGIGGPG